MGRLCGEMVFLGIGGSMSDSEQYTEGGET